MVSCVNFCAKGNQKVHCICFFRVDRDVKWVSIAA